jgi:ABC-type amino acid transport substrate-binding protein
MKQNFKWIMIILIIGVLGASCSANDSSSDETATRFSVAVLGDNPPFTFVDEASNKIDGFDINLMDEIAKRAGYKADYDIVDDWNAILQSMYACSHDAYFSRIMEFPKGDTHCWQMLFQGKVVDEWCEQDVVPIRFSKPYFQNGFVVLVRADNRDILSYGDLSGKKIGMDIYYDNNLGLISALGKKPFIFHDLDDAIQALLEYDLDAIVDDFPRAYNYVLASEGKIKIVGEPFYPTSSSAIAVCVNYNTVLLDAVNTALDEIMSDGTFDDLAQKWSMFNYE